MHFLYFLFPECDQETKTVKESLSISSNLSNTHSTSPNTNNTHFLIFEKITLIVSYDNILIIIVKVFAHTHTHFQRPSQIRLTVRKYRHVHELLVIIDAAPPLMIQLYFPRFFSKLGNTVFKKKGKAIGKPEIRTKFFQSFMQNFWSNLIFPGF